MAARARAEAWASSPTGREREREGGAEYAERMIKGTAVRTMRFYGKKCDEVEVQGAR